MSKSEAIVYEVYSRNKVNASWKLELMALFTSHSLEAAKIKATKMLRILNHDDVNYRTLMYSSDNKVFTFKEGVWFDGKETQHA